MIADRIPQTGLMGFSKASLATWACPGSPGAGEQSREGAIIEQQPENPEELNSKNSKIKQGAAGFLHGASLRYIFPCLF